MLPSYWMADATQAAMIDTDESRNIHRTISKFPAPLRKVAAVLLSIRDRRLTWQRSEGRSCYTSAVSRSSVAKHSNANCRRESNMRCQMGSADSGGSERSPAQALTVPTAPLFHLLRDTHKAILLRVITQPKASLQRQSATNAVTPWFVFTQEGVLQFRT